MLIRTADGARLQSRHHKDLTRYFPDLAVAAEVLPHATVLDGELVIWDTERRKTSFGLLGRRITAGRALAAEAVRHPAHLVCFDLLYLRGADLMNQPLHRRRRRLEELLAAGPPQLALCPQSSDLADVEMWLHDGPAAGVEGVLIKPSNGIYQPGRTGWWKLRAHHSIEAVIAGITGTLRNPATVLLARLDHKGHLRYIGRTTPLSTGARRALADLLSSTDRHPWPRPLPSSWQGILGDPEPLPFIPVAPVLVAEVRADAAYEGGRYRHPIHFLRTRLDLEPSDLPEWTVHG